MEDLSVSKPHFKAAPKSFHDILNDYKQYNNERNIGSVSEPICDITVYVEGRTDFNFFEKRFKDLKFEYKLPNTDFSNKDNKKWIIDRLTKNRFKSITNEFGVVDKDFTDSGDVKYYGLNVFLYDTHDLETLLLSTDNELFGKLRFVANHGQISQKEIDRAKYVAYQIGIIKSALPDNNSKYNSECGTYINEEDKVYLNSYFSGLKTKTIAFDQLKRASIIRSNFERCPKTDIFLFNKNMADTLSCSDFWDVVNGHDICSILKFFNEKISSFYYAPGELNRKMENDMIDNYKILEFQNTDIFKSMKRKGLLSEDNFSDEKTPFEMRNYSR